MPRRRRVHFPGALYRVISRGNQRQKIYKDDVDYRRFETLLGEVIQRHSLVLYAYVLMPNQLHLLLEVGRAPLTKAMQTLLCRYTHRYNQRHRKIGHLFQGRYKAILWILCDRDSYLMELIRYLHLNPVRGGMVSDPIRYSWSSHGAYLRGKSTSGIAVEEGLKLWGSQRNQAVKSYQRFVRDGLGVGHQEEYYEVKEQRYLGDDKFVESMNRTIDDQDEIRPIEITMAEILKVVAEESGMAPETLRGKGRGRVESPLRAEALFAGREVGGIGLTHAANYLRRDPSTLSLTLRRLEDRLAIDSDQRKRMEHLCARLRQGRWRKYQISKA